MFVLPRAISRTDDVLVYCHGRALETVATYKYRGAFLDSELSWRHHIDHVLRKVSRKIFALRTAGSTLKSRRQYLSVIQPDLQYGSTAFSSSLSAREKARIFQASRKGNCAIARASPWTPTTPLWRFLDLHHCQCVLTWSCCSSHIDVCTLLPAPFFVASTNWEPKQTARTAQHVVKPLTLSVFLQLLAALVN